MKTRNLSPRLTRLLLLLTLGLFGAGGTLGCATDAAVISQANQFHGGLKPAVIEDPALANYIQSVGDRVIAAAREVEREGNVPKASKNHDNSWMFSDKIKFHFVNSKTVNAFTTGGEHMYIYTELFRQAKTEDELAAVMAHEFGHIYGRHVQQGMNRQYAILGSALAAAGAGYVAGGKEHGAEYAGLAAAGAGAAGQLVGMSFTRKDEDEADRLGFEFYVRAGYDPVKFGNFFQTMIDKGYDKGPEFLSDHPSLKNRVAAAKERAANLPRQAREWRREPVADNREFQDLQARATRVGQNMPTDQTLAGAQELLQALPRSCLTPAIQEDQLEAEKDLERRMERESQQAKGSDRVSRKG
jgi:predicted Zn-dependent protease